MRTFQLAAILLISAACVFALRNHPSRARRPLFFTPFLYKHNPTITSSGPAFRRRAQEQLHLSLTGVANEVALDFVVHPANATQVAVTLNGAPVSADCATATINSYT
jgi:hypothetical protein